MKKNVILLITGFFCVLILFLFIYHKIFTAQIVYVDNQKIFDSFNMTKELKMAGEKELGRQRKIVDSLYLILNDASLKESREALTKIFIAEKDKLEYFNTSYSTEQSVKIWGRIDGYGKKFAEDNNYDIILGAQPGQNLIFGKDDKNVTAKFIQFINNKYEGIK